MTEKRAMHSGPGTAAMGWAGLLNDFWSPMVKNYGETFAGDAPPEADEAKGRMSEAMLAMTKLWQTLVSSLKEPEVLENFQKATQLAPDIAMGFSQTCMQGFIKIQIRVNEWVLKRGADTAEFDTQAFDQEFINLWTSIYENELSQYLKIPQLGLGRVYQERVMHATDELNRFQAVLSSFMHLLYLPLEKSFKTLQERMTEMAEAGSLDDQSKTYYNLWIKLLEGHYMELFKAEEFSNSLGDTLAALNTFVEARQAVVNDVLKMYSIPTNKDLDKLYKEIYLLKKRMRAYEKQ